MTNWLLRETPVYNWTLIAISISIICGVLLAVLTLTDADGSDYFFTEYHSPDTYSWAGTADTGYYKVYYAETSKDTIEQLCPGFKKPQGCHTIIPVDDQQYHLVAIPLKGGYQYHEGLPGCNIYTHETLHGWGYKEAMMPGLFTCDQESKYTHLPVLGVTRR